LALIFEAQVGDELLEELRLFLVILIPGLHDIKALCESKEDLAGDPVIDFLPLPFGELELVLRQLLLVLLQVLIRKIEEESVGEPEDIALDAFECFLEALATQLAHLC